jgi:hypothetical protein
MAILGVREAEMAASEERSFGVHEMAKRGVRMGWTRGGMAMSRRDDLAEGVGK